jgi:BirA family transcriptional regulator, biotin operon repressor / biotin---[acetyl-CoA-carboxylase] ligase
LSLTTASIVEFETIDSTNSEAHRRAAAGARGPLWIRADQQEQGRGRSGRPWSSPPGNLSATYMFTPASELGNLHQLSFVAALAGHDAISQHVSDKSPLQLKWPNDLLIGDAKICGILIESARYGNDVVAMIGMGVNIAVAPEIEHRAVTQLDRHGEAVKPQALLEDIAAKMDHWLSIWNGGAGFEKIRAAWLERAHPQGQPLTVNSVNEQLAGVFQGLAENGALILTLPTGETIRVEHGDVALATTMNFPKERA